MDGTGKGFRYRMESLLRVRLWDLDVARAEEVQARGVVTQRVQEMSQAQVAIGEIEASIRNARAQGGNIDPDRQQMLGLLLATRHDEYQRKLSEVKEAEQLHEQTRKRLLRVKQGVLTLEKHKSGQQEEHAAGERRAEQKQMDDLWLMRLRGRERAP